MQKIRRKIRKLNVVANLFLIQILFSCTFPPPTIYQPYSDSEEIEKWGGYKEEKINDENYKINFIGNKSTWQNLAFRYVLYRASEIAIAKNYTHFEIDNVRDRSMYLRSELYSGGKSSLLVANVEILIHFSNLKSENSINALNYKSISQTDKLSKKHYLQDPFFLLKILDICEKGELYTIKNNQSNCKCLISNLENMLPQTVLENYISKKNDSSDKEMFRVKKVIKDLEKHCKSSHSDKLYQVKNE